MRSGYALGICCFVLLLAACTGGDEQAADGVTELSVWFHTGKPAESATIEDQVARFNDTHDDLHLELVLIPEQGYHTKVEAAAADGSLPDILDFDGPYLANYAWKGHLQPLGPHIGQALLDELLPSIREQGSYAGQIYGLGSFDSGLGLYADHAALTAAGVRVPDGIGDAWTLDEFASALDALREHDEDGEVLDLGLNDHGEWYTYAFSPCLVSAGGDLVTRTHPPRAAGILDGEESVRAMRAIQGWITDDYVDPNTDDRAFVDRRVALSWSGHWDHPRYREALGEDLVLVPLPDFGAGSRTGQGSWTWGVSSGCEEPAAAARFIAFLLETEEVLAMSRANGAVPATRSAIARSQLYSEDGPLHLFAEQLERIAVPRPVTPTYPAITQAFQDAFEAIRRGGNVVEALSEAAERIDRDVRDHKGYPRAGE